MVTGRDLTSGVYEREQLLIAAAIEGDEQAVGELIDLHRVFLNALAFRMLRNREDASDAVQETVYKAIRSFGEFQTGRPVKPWLGRICFNCCVDAVRQRKRNLANVPLDENLAEALPPLDEQIWAKLRRTQIIEAIGRLPSQYRQIILMRHFRHMDVSEIACELQKPEGTIKSWLFRAREILKRDLRPAFQ